MTALIPVPLRNVGRSDQVTVDAGDFGLYPMDIIEGTAGRLNDPMQRLWMIVLLAHVAELLRHDDVPIVRLGVLSRSEALTRSLELKCLSQRMGGERQ